MRFNCPKLSNSLSLRISLTFMTGALVSVALLVAIGAIANDRLPGMEMPDQAENLMRKLDFDATGRPIGLSAEHADLLWIYDSLWQEISYRILDEAGNVVLASRGAQSWPENDDVTRLENWRFDIYNNGVYQEGGTERIEHDGRVWFVQITTSSRMINFLHQEFAIPFITKGGVSLGIILLFVFVPCAYICLQISLRPIRAASVAAAEISLKSINERLKTDRVPPEINPLIDSFNTALDRIENGFRIQQDFLAKAAHELKTPLALMRAELDLMDVGNDIRDPLLTQIEHLSRHVQQLLLLAEASEPLSYQFSDVDVQEAANDAKLFLKKISDEADVNLTICAPNKSVTWRADRSALFTLLKNLIENAIQHAPSGTEVRIEIDQSYVSVRDWGPGIAQEKIALMFTRFWREAHRRDSGAGLGLAICREIATAHGWFLAGVNKYPGLEMKVMRIESLS